MLPKSFQSSVLRHVVREKAELLVTLLKKLA
ncbi:hypothetical protein Pvag_2983 [Pantoea vagans C9-1]|nr:hypothetical protein Pvag_2983 [Pantoea vagans C9-1]